MRRLLSVAALAAALFAAGCGGSDSPSPGGTGTPGTGASATVDVAANTKAVCESSEKVVSEGLAAVLAEVGKMIAAEASGNTAAANTARTAAEAAATKLVSDIRLEAGKAADPALKSALENAATQFEAMAKDVKSIDEKKLEAAGAAVTAICG